METPETPPAMGFAEKLMSVKRHTLYLLLIVATSVPTFFSITLPNKPDQPSIDFFTTVMALPEGSTILIETDWTKSTRGDSMAQMQALLRILMRHNIKFAIYSTADPAAPQVARDTIGRLSEERRAKGERPYVRWEDWVDLGYFPNSEATNNAIATNIRKAFAGKTEVPGVGQPARDVFRSPVLSKIQKVGDMPLLLVVTASKTFDIIVERLYGKVPLAAMVTGVMGPECTVYYASGQMVGLCVGLKGALDIERLMESGVNNPPEKPVVVNKKSPEVVPGFPGAINEGNGKAYYPTLHVALALMILAVVIGNIGMVLTRKGAKS